MLNTQMYNYEEGNDAAAAVKQQRLGCQSWSAFHKILTFSLCYIFDECVCVHTLTHL